MKYRVFEELNPQFLGYVFADSLKEALKKAYSKFPEFIALTVKEAAE